GARSVTWRQFGQSYIPACLWGVKRNRPWVLVLRSRTICAYALPVARARTATAMRRFLTLASTFGHRTNGAGQTKGWSVPFPSLMKTDCRGAFAAGLTTRPLTDTIRDTLAWAASPGGAASPSLDYGLPLERAGLSPAPGSAARGMAGRGRCPP